MAWSRRCSADGQLARRSRRVHRGTLLVPVALRAAAVSVLHLVHHRHVRRRPHRRPRRGRAAARAAARGRLRPRLLAGVHRAGRLVQRGRPAAVHVSRRDPAPGRRAHHPLWPLHRGRAADRLPRADGFAADPGEAGGLRRLLHRRCDVRGGLDAMRGADPRRDPLARRHGGDGRARRWPPRRVLGGAGPAVPVVGAGAGALLEVLQALPTVHSRHGARRRRAARDRGRARVHQLLPRPQLLGELDHPGVAPQAPVAGLFVHVRVPATSANLGPGFDALGLALALYNDVEASEADGVTVTVEGEGAGSLPVGADNIVARGVRLAFEAAGRPFKGAAIRCVNRIPPARGLGSSAAAWVGGLLAGNALAEAALANDEVLTLAARAEGHPDNVAAALLGGLTVSCAAPAGTGTAASLPVPSGLAWG